MIAAFRAVVAMALAILAFAIIAAACALGALPC